MSNISKLRTISIDPQYLKMSKKTIKQKPMISSEININSNNIKQLLLEKLRQHKKSKKNRGPLIQTNTFDEQNMPAEPTEYIDKNKPIEVTMLDRPEVSTPTINPDVMPFPEPEPREPRELVESNIQPDRPYGVLKNGTKPTYKIWSKQETEPVTAPIAEKPVDIIEEREITKTYVLGKKNKSVTVLITNNKTRKNNAENKLNLKKTSMSTLKNNLKKNNLIKFGTTAPSDLLREIYENSKICGDITNHNPTNIVHNFKEA